MIKVWAASAMLIAGMAAAPAIAGMPVSETMTCPVGGRSFEFVTTSSYSTWGSRPDGKPYGSWEFPLKMPVCPGNGLVVYKKFSADEIKRLGKLVSSIDYKRLAGDTSYYRAAWLMRELGEKPDEIAWVVNQASWQADGRPDLKARYQRDFIAHARALPGGLANTDSPRSRCRRAP